MTIDIPVILFMLFTAFVVGYVAYRMGRADALAEFRGGIDDFYAGYRAEIQQLYADLHSELARKYPQAFDTEGQG